MAGGVGSTVGRYVCGVCVCVGACVGVGMGGVCVGRGGLSDDLHMTWSKGWLAEFDRRWSGMCV